MKEIPVDELDLAMDLVEAEVMLIEMRLEYVHDIVEWLSTMMMAERTKNWNCQGLILRDH